MSDSVKAILLELKRALENLKEENQGYTIYVENTGLMEEEQVALLETLGRGHISIDFHETDQPVEWYESAISGVWIGTYRNGRNDAIVHTIEVARYPQIAQAFDEDLIESVKSLETWI